MSCKAFMTLLLGVTTKNRNRFEENRCSVNVPIFFTDFASNKKERNIFFFKEEKFREMTTSIHQ